MKATIEELANFLCIDVQHVLALARKLKIKKVSSRKSSIDNISMRKIIDGILGPQIGSPTRFRLNLKYGYFAEDPDFPTWSEKENERTTAKINPKEQSLFYQNQVKEISKTGTQKLKRQFKDLQRQIAEEVKRGDSFAADELRNEAFEITRKLSLLEDYRSLADLWRVAPNWSEEQSSVLYDKILADQEWLPLLALDGNLNHGKYLMLRIKFKNYIAFLSDTIRAGDTWAAKLLAEILMEGIQELNSAYNENPKFLNGISKDYAAWPLLVSQHRNFSDHTKTLIANVGTGLPFEIRTFSQWDPNDHGTKIAMELLIFIYRLKLQYANRFESCDGFPLFAALEKLPDKPTDMRIP